MRTIGTKIYGVRAPIIRPNDDLVEIVTDSILRAVEEEKLTLKEKDIVAVTEAVVAKAENNYASLSDITEDIKSKITNDTLGLIFPILSRNRFSSILKAISRSCKNLVIQLSYPFDEVGNPLLTYEQLDEKDINPYTDEFEEEEFRSIFNDIRHPFTHIDYVEYYKSIAPNAKIIFSNNPLTILKYTDNVINADIHTRNRTKNKLLKNNAKVVLSLSDILTQPVNNSGYHPLYGVLGSNASSDEVVKLFPRDSQKFVEELQLNIYKKTKVLVECMVYGDGAFKDPVGGIWELADPVVSPGHTNGLIGLPNELKLKYIADDKLVNLSKEEALAEIKKMIKEKEANMSQTDKALGTTPRKITDLLGSLCDLTTGSGDKGTPIVLIKGYFDNMSDE